MPYKNVNRIILSPDYCLPYIEANDKRSFLHLYKQKMRRFIADLRAMDQFAFNRMKKSVLINEVKTLSDGLQDVMGTYLNGYPAEAFEMLKKILNKDQLYQHLNYNRQIRITDGSALYRSKRIFDPKEAGKPDRFLKKPNPHTMFHIPFEKRKAIGTNRYSIPGFPCIYLSDHLQTSWSECMEEEKEPFYAICFRNHRPLYLVDLVPLNVVMEAHKKNVPANLFMSMDEELALTNYLQIYPIVCACHSKIKYKEEYNGEVKFKSEYIVPQLLMQWYRDSKVPVDGIRYLSCTAETRFPGSTFNKHNFVIPVDICEETGLCPNLVANFSSTDVYAHRRPTGNSPEVMLNDIQLRLAIASVTPLS